MQDLAQFGSGSRVIQLILKEKIKNNFREKQFSLKKYGIFLKTTYKNKMAPKEIFSQLSL